MGVDFHGDFATLRRRPDVVIVGGGIVGIATAYFLNQHGIRPCIVERLPTPASLTSRRSGEGVRAQWVLQHNIAIARASIDFYEHFGERIGIETRSSGFRKIGYLYASRADAGSKSLGERVDEQIANGLDDVVFLGAEDARKRFPLLSPDVKGAAYRAGDGVVVVSDIIAGYLAAMDADIVLGVDILSISQNGGALSLNTSGGAIDAPTVILANGARLPAMLSALGIDIPVRLARSSIFHVKTDAIPFDHPATIDVDVGAFWRPDVGGARITASFRRTLFIDTFTDEPQPDADYMTHAIDTVSPLVPLWRQIAPTIADSHARHGTFAVSGDGSPLIGAIDGIPGLYVNGAYGGHGIMMSPDGGRRLAEIVAATGVGEPNPFDPARFAGGKMPRPEPMTVNTNDATKVDR